VINSALSSKRLARSMLPVGHRIYISEIMGIHDDRYSWQGMVPVEVRRLILFIMDATI